MTGGYDPAHFEKLFAVEDRHFWFRARNRVLSLLCRKITADLAPGFRVLEVGCGDGNVLRFLESACATGSVIGMDYFLEGLQYARRRCCCPLVQGDIARPPFSTTFQIIGIFDVLEHLTDDRGVLRDLWRLLDDTGKLLITVPAHMSLWSAFDEASGHCRRYSRKELEEKLTEAGFRVDFITPYMASIFPLVWLARRLGKLFRQRDATEGAVERELHIIPFVNEILTSLLLLEARWISRRRRLPFGASLLAPCGFFGHYSGTRRN